MNKSLSKKKILFTAVVLSSLLLSGCYGTVKEADFPGKLYELGAVWSKQRLYDAVKLIAQKQGYADASQVQFKSLRLDFQILTVTITSSKTQEDIWASVFLDGRYSETERISTDDSKTFTIADVPALFDNPRNLIEQTRGAISGKIKGYSFNVRKFRRLSNAVEDTYTENLELTLDIQGKKDFNFKFDPKTGKLLEKGE